jgi:hypothetical protein
MSPKLTEANRRKFVGRINPAAFAQNAQWRGINKRNVVC